MYGTENLVIATASATAEILAGFYFDNDYPIDAVTAQALYVGIATDTGQFRFPSTTPSTFEITRRLCEHGANPSAAAYELYEKESFAKIQLLKKFLDSLTMDLGGLVCIGLIKEGDYKTTGATIDDSEGLVDYARAIDGVEIGVMIEERNGAIKGSLRASDPKFRVDQIAKEFGGGGHACAAGLNLDCSTIEEFLPQLRSAIDKCLKELKNKHSNYESYLSLLWGKSRNLVEFVWNRIHRLYASYLATFVTPQVQNLLQLYRQQILHP